MSISSAPSATEFEAQLQSWRHHLHRHPETGFNERRTADHVARVLELLGIEVQRHIGSTGIVGTLTVGHGTGAIGLRADMDALALTEAAEGRAHASLNPGCMHACGHDGHMAIDPLVIGAEIVLALQTIVARSVDPGQPAVVSCTEFVTDGIRNALPTHVTIKGDTRSYAPEVQALLARRIREVSEGICAAHGARCEVEYTHEFAPTVNWAPCVPVAVTAAVEVVGADRVDDQIAPMMISEDFGAFLRVVPGAFVFIGNGDGDSPGAVPLHNARYDFNDALLPIGARFFAEIIRQRLPRQEG